MLKESLINYWLTTREADIYLLSLEYGTIKPATLAKKLTLNRTTCYDILASMVKKQLLVETTWKGQKHYEAVSPSLLLQSLSEKYSAFESIIPQLEILNNAYGIKAKIKVFEWFENVIHMYAKMLNSSTDIKVMMGYEVKNESFLQWRDEYFVPERVKRGIHIRVISYETEFSKRYQSTDHENKRETRFMKIIDKKLMCWWFLFDTNKCLIIMYDDKDISSIIIESKSIHDLGETIFDQLRIHLD